VAHASIASPPVALNTRRADLDRCCNSTMSGLPATASGGIEPSRTIGRRAWRGPALGADALVLSAASIGSFVAVLPPEEGHFVVLEAATARASKYSRSHTSDLFR